MRLKADLKMSTDWLNKDYRNIFMALIKNAFENYDPVLLNQLYGTENEKRKVNKQFTFFARFPDYKGIQGNRMNCGEKVTLYFSSPDEKIVIAFYNGLMYKRKIIIGENFPITVSVQYVNLLPKKTIASDKVAFRTVAPVLVNETGSNYYLSPAVPEFSKAFKTVITQQANIFNIPCSEDMIQFEINSMKKLPLSHYNQTMTSWMGEFVLEAPVKVLQMVYDMGIGVRRSQGFGMLDIIKIY